MQKQITKKMNYLRAVFWDYPKFIKMKYLKDYINKNKNNKGYFWIMQRFIEHGRVVDTLTFFGLQEISKNLQELKISPYNRKKWSRIIEVYDKGFGK
jgi:hypothetical protein